ncbi:hypothetical protein CC86DRAFT_384355 [Ophiobolus disseminans]|uniref:Heterokaryon incompatibility domain-containing protein n=1 Tax=Ophiobolus disseminans TaxID=1469910 RepID=A0A6A6ZSP9_9PLEO|nr:hypothetical protein CC86DRAFT_384355 [Ophiobolus disseminans]
MIGIHRAICDTSLDPEVVGMNILETLIRILPSFTNLTHGVDEWFLRLNGGRAQALGEGIEVLVKYSGLDKSMKFDETLSSSEFSVSGYTGSDEAVYRAQSWLKTCLEGQFTCGPKLGISLPTRILWIRGPEDVFLYEPVNIEDGEYACLSHCWGGQSLIQTTTSTIHQYKVAIPWAEFPRTFREAVSFTYRLGIQRIIPYACCLSCTQCLVSVLMERAWALQERILSLRILHFMNEELWFECYQGFACECSYMGFDRSFQDQTPYHFLGQVRVKPVLDEFLGESHDPPIPMAHWRQLVEEYSARVKNLTHPGDAFPALQGLAKTMSLSMGTYLAGHWETSSAQSLLWRVAEVTTKPRPVEWRAPSWSWASVDQPISWQFLDAKICFTVVKSATVPRCFDPTEQLLSGAIVARGQCLKATIVYVNQHDGSPRPSVIFEFHKECLDTCQPVGSEGYARGSSSSDLSLPTR